MKKKVLLVEDEASLREMIKLNLEMEGFEVEDTSDGKMALEKADKLDEYALVILDVMLPHVSGFDICRTYREHSNVPILFLSAKGTTTDRIAGLKLGANDYLPKPFDLEELLLRVFVLTGKNESTTATEKLLIGNKSVDFKTFDVEENGSPVTTLTKREIDLLQLFNLHSGEVVSRNMILDEIWGVDQYPTSRTIDNYILNFRKIFEKDPKHPVYFHSIRGVGYKFTP
ncbi:response regulator transcription factor [Wandonia haliotis]|uniref:Response regulator transcription factor n=1 Tax=Wandonia haliotis TaxID=574963 RepID=A0ABN1MU12_9FLAO